MIKPVAQVRMDERVHLVHVSADPENPHAEDPEEGQGESHQSIVSSLTSVLSTRVHVLAKDASCEEEDPQENVSSSPQSVFFYSHSIIIFLLTSFAK